MARRFLDDIRQDIIDNINDNIVGDITPLDLRTILRDMVDSTIQDECILVATTPVVNFPVTNSWQFVPGLFNFVIGGTPPFLRPSIPDQWILLADTLGWSYNVQILIGLDGGPNQEWQIGMLRNGIIDNIPVELVTRGGGREEVITIPYFIPSSAANESIQVGIRSDTPNNVTIANARLAVTIVPTNSP